MNTHLRFCRPTTLALLITALPPLVEHDAKAQQMAGGVVYEDRNGNGLRDADEPGLPGVAVSNQDLVVLTDEEGRYELPVVDDTIIFVSKPADYALPVNENNLPRFYYLHKPDGSPSQRYEGVPPTGELPASVDFALLAAEPTEKFRVIAMADPQPEIGQEVLYIRDDVLNELPGVGAAFGITLGDIMSNQLDYYRPYNANVGKVGIPFYNVIGNHDMNFDAADDRDSDETFHRWFGPNYYSWNHGKVHFVALDTVNWLGKLQGHYRGNFDEKQMRWLANDIAQVPAEHLVVLLMHIPIMTPEGYECDHTERLFDVLKDRAKVLALAGHMHFHENVFLGEENGWHGAGAFHLVINGAVSGSWWSGPKDYRGIPVTPCRDGVPNGYSIVTFDGADYVLDYKPASEDPALRMNIYPPGMLAQDDVGRRTVLVNVFDGSDRTQVEFSLDSGPFTVMEQAPQRDPLSEAMLTGPRAMGKPWASVNVCQHMWKSVMAEGPGGGTHAIVVRVTDHYGRTFTQTKIFGF